MSASTPRAPGDVRRTGQAREVLVVGARCRVAEESAPQTVDVELQRAGPGGDELQLFGRELLATPPGAVPDRPEHLAFAVAGEKERADASQLGEALRLKRAPQHVASDDDRVDALLADLLENCLSAIRLP